MRRIGAGLLWVLLVGCQQPGSATPTDDPQSIPATADWMGEVFAEAPDTALNRILLPGTRNSTSYACEQEYGISPLSPEWVLALWGDGDANDNQELRQIVVDWAKTQDQSVGEQLIDGIRSMQLRFTLKDGVLTTWHSVYGVPATEVFDDIVSFATAHPTEAVVFLLELDNDEAQWAIAADELTTPRAGGVSMCDLFFDGPGNAAVAPLADIQDSGRTLVPLPDAGFRAFVDERGDCPMPDLQIDAQWSITLTTEGVESKLEQTVDARDLTRLLQNDFTFSLDGADDSLAQASYVLQYPTLLEAELAFGFLDDFPSRLITQFDEQQNMNLFIGDFYQHTTLVEAAIDGNRTRAPSP